MKNGYKDYFVVPFTEENRDKLLEIVAKGKFAPKEKDLVFGTILEKAYVDFENRFSIDHDKEKKYKEEFVYIDSRVFSRIIWSGTKKTFINLIIEEFFRNHAQEEILEMVKNEME